MDEIVEFPIHFNVPNHYLRVDDFVAFSVDVKKIITELNAKAFNKSTSVEIFILPAEEGGFLGKWGIKITVTSVSIGSLFMVMDTDIAKGFVRGLTTHEPAYYAEMAGSETRKGAILLADVTRGFLEKDADAKELDVVKKEDFSNAYSAKNDFYKKCLLNKNISEIGFTCEDDFSIKRNSFAYKIAALVDGDLGPEPEYEIYQLRIVSPVNVLDSKAQWQLQDVQTHRTLRAYLKDDHFQKDFFNGKYPLKVHEEDDIIIAMVEFKKNNIEGEEKVIERNIIKVYKFNEIVLDEIPEYATISAVSRARSGVSEKQLSFLDGLTKD